MRTTSIKIKEKEYLLCFSTRVMLTCEARNGSVDEELKLIYAEAEKGKMHETIWFLYELLKAGSKYAEVEGLENPPLMNYETFIDSIGIDDFDTLFSKVTEAVKSGNERKVETEVPKNAEATLTEAMEK